MKQWIIIFVALSITFSCNDAERNKIDERYTLKLKDDSPFGGSAFYRLVQQQYPYETENYNLPFSKWYAEEYNNYDADYPIVYIITAPRLMAWKADAEAMQSFVADGNTLVLAADYFTSDLMDAFGFEHRDINEMSPTRFPFESHTAGTRYTQKNLKDSVALKKYEYFYTEMRNSFSLEESVITYDTLGFNNLLRPDILRYHFEDGELILFTNARALSNYFLLTADNLAFGQDVINFLPADVYQLVYDNFYSSNIFRQPPDKSIFAAFLQKPALRWAFWIIVVGSLLWLLLSLRRKQRMMPVKVTNTNESIAFTKTIANLYLNSKDNKNIALKMIAHFIEILRQRYYLPLSLNDPKAAAQVAAKTGVNQELAESLFMQVAMVQAAFEVSDEELMKLHFTVEKILQGSGVNRPAIKTRSTSY